MFAVIRTGSKQYGITEGSKISVEKLGEKPGESLSIDDVLLVEKDGKTSVGTPQVSGAKIEAKVVRHFRGEKKTIFKKRRRHGYRLKKGHRQEMTEIEITSINN